MKNKLKGFTLYKGVVSSYYDDKKLLIIVGVFVFIIISFRMIWIGIFLNQDDPHVQKGVLDLRKLSLQERSSISLNGQWLFYLSQFVNPNSNKDKLKMNNHHSWITVPIGEKQ
ncbi:hypothetical protein ACQKCU_10160 [Heyndrickxia sporothermodurans]